MFQAMCESMYCRVWDGLEVGQCQRAEGLCMEEAQWRMRDTPGGRVAEDETQVSQVRLEERAE